jgi:hypothetical protein
MLEVGTDKNIEKDRRMNILCTKYDTKGLILILVFLG